MQYSIFSGRQILDFPAVQDSMQFALQDAEKGGITAPESVLDPN
jgi:hypothetical protein